MDIRKRKSVVLISLFNLVMGLIILPLLIRPQSIVAWWSLCAKGLLLLVAAILAATTVHWAVSNILLRGSMRALRRADYERALLLTGR